MLSAVIKVIEWGLMIGRDWGLEHARMGMKGLSYIDLRGGSQRK